MPTLDEARAEVGRLSQGPGWFASPGGSIWTATSLQDALLQDATRGASFYVRRYVRRTGVGLLRHQRNRRIVSYDPVLGIVVPQYQWSPVPAAGEPYELGWLWPPNLVDEALARVQRRMYTPVEVALPSVTGALQYGLTDAAAWLQAAGQLERVVARTGAAGAQTSTVLTGARARQVATGGMHDVSVGLASGPLGTAETLVARGWTSYADLTPLVDPDDVTIAPLDWLAWEAIWDLTQQPQMNVDDDLRRRAARELGPLRKGSAPPASYPLFADGPAWGAAGVGRY